MSHPALQVSGEVREALARRRGVVALESSLISHGLPAPHNLEAALAAEAAIRREGATPATIAIADARIVVGADRSLLERLADPLAGAAKAASRDIGPLLAGGVLAATTVSATMRAAAMAGIRLFATGGIGGVHHGAARTFDVSSDIDELAATGVAVVSSGAKSILDMAATLELLETRRIPVIGLGTGELPAFTSPSSGLAVPHRVDSMPHAARVVAAHLALPGAGGLLLVQPPPRELAIPLDQAARWIEEARSAAELERVSGAAVTPFVLAHVARASAGRSLRANAGLIVNNARAAAQIALALAALEHH